MSARPYNQQLTALEPRAAPLNHPAHQKSHGEGIVIDHRFSPHIIDLIWSSMPYPSLVVATMVCKTWREDSIKRLFEHVTVRECDGDDNDIVIRSRNTLWPQYSAVLIKTGKDDVDDLEDIVTLTEVGDLLHNPNNPLFKRSKPCYLFEMLDEQSKTIRLQTPPAVEMFRVRHVTAPTFICFLDYSVQFCLTRASVVCATSDLTLSLDCYDDPTAPIVPTAANQTPWYLHLCTGMEHLDSFTIVLIDKTKHDPPRPTVTPLAPHIPDAGEIASNFLNRAPPTLGIVYEVLRLACTVFEVDSISITGAEVYLAEQDQESYYDEIRRTLNSEAEAMRNSVDEELELGDKIEFFTHEEYRKLVGEDRYRLETVR